MNAQDTIYRDPRKPEQAASVKTECSRPAVFTTGPAYQAGPAQDLEPAPRLTGEQFESAYQKGHATTVRVLLKHGASVSDAEEFAQAAWVRAWERRTTLRKPGHLLFFVIQIALNMARDQYRRRARTVGLEASRNVAVPAEVNLWAIDLRRGMDRCSEPQCELLEQVYLAEQSAAEAAQVLRISVQAVYARTSRALKVLRKHMNAV